MSRIRMGSARQSPRHSETSEDAENALVSFINSKLEGKNAQTSEDLKSPRSDTGTTVLTYFPSALFATILEDTIMKIRALIDCSTESTINKILVDIDVYLRRKYGVQEAAAGDLVDMIGSRSVDSDQFKMYKMDEDRTVFTEVMCATYLDLALDLNYKSLTAKIGEIMEHSRVYVTLKEEVNRNQIRAKEVRKQLRHLNMRNKTVMYDANALLDKLQKNIEDSELTQETQARYIEKWEHARSEQHNEVFGIREKESNDSIRYFRDRVEKEQVVHSEIDSLVNMVIKDTMAQIQTWMTKYEKDIEAMDLKIQVKRNEYEIALEKRVQMEEMMIEHEKEMLDWNKFKHKRAEARKYFEDMNRCAIIVQSWWRGLLVRRELGPYKPPKRRKGGNKKAK